MPDRICAHCLRLFSPKQPRQWCYDCLPAHGTVNPAVYSRRAVALDAFKKSGRHLSCCGLAPARTKKTPPPRTCARCGGIREPRARYCARCSVDACAESKRRAAAAQRAKRTAGRGPRRCSDCSAEIDRHRNKCDACSGFFRKAQSVRRRSVERPCLICGTSLVGDTRLVCAGACAAERRRALNRSYRAEGRPSVRRGRLKYKARKRGQRPPVHEPYALLEVAERDGWRCGLCRRKVDPAASGAMRPSIDHIVPLSLGGTDELANVQLAHLRCNVSKGNRPAGEQLRLVG